MLIPKPKPGHTGPPTPWRLMGMGLELGLIIGGLTFLGYLGDKRWGTDPWLALTGALVSTLGGCYNLIKEAAKLPTPHATPKNKNQTPDR
ncbi:MAG: AtpZ/AtpI family protein [Planctomycetota bacterium]